jgi:hypothetical protein
VKTLAQLAEVEHHKAIIVHLIRTDFKIFYDKISVERDKRQKTVVSAAPLKQEAKAFP